MENTAITSPRGPISLASSILSPTPQSKVDSVKNEPLKANIGGADLLQGATLTSVESANRLVKSVTNSTRALVGPRPHSGLNRGAALRSRGSSHPEKTTITRGVAGKVSSTTRSTVGSKRITLTWGDGERLDVIRAWYQGLQGNCVTLAAIKAAQACFGASLAADSNTSTNGIFKRADYDEDGNLSIVMCDNFKLILTKEELREGREKADLRIGNENPSSTAVKMLDNAKTLFAIAAKRAQIEGNDDIGPNAMNYTEACWSLNDGEFVHQVSEHFQRLGLEHHARQVRRRHLSKYSYGLASGFGHAYFVTEGKRDDYGNVIELGKGYSKAWIIEP